MGLCKSRKQRKLNPKLTVTKRKGITEKISTYRLVVDEGVRRDRVDEDVVGEPQLLEVVGQVDLLQQQRKLALEDVGHQVVLNFF